jgi:hypothetical protein
MEFNPSTFKHVTSFLDGHDTIGAPYQSRFYVILFVQTKETRI